MVRQVAKALKQTNNWEDLKEFKLRIRVAFASCYGLGRRKLIKKICKEYYA
jgi:hypothetical protein